MALSDKYKKKAKAMTEERVNLAVEQSRNKVNELMQTDQFRLSVMATPEAGMFVESIIKTTVDTILDPVAQYIDILRAKGFKSSEIRMMADRHYRAHLVKFDDVVPEDLVYEDIIDDVANFFLQNQELYNSCNPEDLR